MAIPSISNVDNDTNVTGTLFTDYLKDTWTTMHSLYSLNADIGNINLSVYSGSPEKLVGANTFSHGGGYKFVAANQDSLVGPELAKQHNSTNYIIGATFRTTDLNAYILARMNNTPEIQGWQLWLENGYLNFKNDDYQYSVSQIVSPLTYNDGNEHLVVITYDWNTRDLLMYVDGLEVASDLNSTTTGYLNLSDTSIGSLIDQNGTNHIYSNIEIGIIYFAYNKDPQILAPSVTQLYNASHFAINNNYDVATINSSSNATLSTSPVNGDIIHIRNINGESSFTVIKPEIIDANSSGSSLSVNGLNFLPPNPIPFTVSEDFTTVDTTWKSGVSQVDILGKKGALFGGEGSTQRIEKGTSWFTSNGTNGGISMRAIVNPVSITGNQTIYARMFVAAQPNLALHIRNGQINFWVRQIGENGRWVIRSFVTNNILTIGNTYEIIIRFNLSTAEIYVNGVLWSYTEENDIGVTMDQLNITNIGEYIGTEYYYTTTPYWAITFNGTISDFSIYDGYYPDTVIPQVPILNVDSIPSSDYGLVTYTDTKMEYGYIKALPYNVSITTEAGTSNEVAVVASNTAPTDILIDSNSILENESIGTLVGNFNTIDADAGDTFTYTLVTGTGDTDNNSFTISGNQLLSGEIFDKETKDVYSVRVRSTDSGGLFTEKQFTINVTNVNEVPTDITLDNTSIDENSSVDTLVGTFNTTDEDIGDTFTYTFVSGTNDNASFKIVGDQLQSNEIFDFETKSSYTIRVRSTDAGSLYIEKDFIITINDINEGPTDILLTSNNIQENESVGTLVGSFSTTDVDNGDTFTYTLVTGIGDTDNSSFTIVDDQLQSNEIFDKETKDVYSVRIRSTDSGGLFTDKQFTINITNVNETPTDILLDNNNIAENESIGTIVGILTSIDPDTGDTFTYSLVNGSGSTDNASFTIVNDQLQSNEIFDFETKSTYYIRIRSTDSSSLYLEKEFVINVTNVNETPTDITLDSLSIYENKPVGSPVGTFTTTDEDIGDSFTYTLVTGTGDIDNSSFTITNDQLLSAEVFNQGVKSSYSILVRSTDAFGASIDKSFIITIIDENEAPTDITISNNSILDGNPAYSEIGIFTTEDPNAGDTATYTFISGTGDDDNSSFRIIGNRLDITDTPSYATQPIYSIRVRSTDTLGSYIDKQFIINIIFNPNLYSPVVTSVIPIFGKSGQTGIKIIGENLNGENIKLYFNDNDVTQYMTLITSTKILFTVPYLVSGIYSIRIEHDGGISNAI